MTEFKFKKGSKVQITSKGWNLLYLEGKARWNPRYTFNPYDLIPPQGIIVMTPDEAPYSSTKNPCYKIAFENHTFVEKFVEYPWLHESFLELYSEENCNDSI